MKNQLSILIILFFILFSCTLPPAECEKVDLSPEEKEWFDVYNEGQQILFSNTQGVTDTLIVKEKMNAYTICYGYKQYNVEVFRMELKHNELDLKCNMKFERSFYSEVTTKSFKIAGLYGFYDTLEGNLKFEKIYLNSKEDSVDTYQMNTSNGSVDVDALIQSFNWSKKFGLVRYVTKENETYELLK